MTRDFRADRVDTTHFDKSVELNDIEEDYVDNLYLSQICKGNLEISKYMGDSLTRILTIPFPFNNIQYIFKVSPNEKTAFFSSELWHQYTYEEMKSGLGLEEHKSFLIDLDKTTYSLLDSNEYLGKYASFVFDSDTSFYHCDENRVLLKTFGGPEAITASFDSTVIENGVFLLAKNRYLMGYEFAYLGKDESGKRLDLIRLAYFDIENNYRKTYIDSCLNFQGIDPFGIYEERSGYYLYSSFFDSLTHSSSLFAYNFEKKSIDTLLTVNGEISSLVLNRFD